VVGFGEFVEGSFRGVSYDLVRRGCGLEGQYGLEKNYAYNKSNEVKKAREHTSSRRCDLRWEESATSHSDWGHPALVRHLNGRRAVASDEQRG
jgi:hypothetical protein